MEFHNLGSHCARPDCKQLDFLPFKCRLCSKTYCLSHRGFEDHIDCIGLTQNHTVDCPLCHNPINGLSSLKSSPETINRLVDDHIAGGCKDPEAHRRERLKAKRPKCTMKGCRSHLQDSSSLRFSCKGCDESYCVKHRHSVDHDCTKRKEEKVALTKKGSPSATSPSASTPVLNTPLKMRTGMNAAGAAALARFAQQKKESPTEVRSHKTMVTPDFTELYKQTSYLCRYSPSSASLATAVDHRLVIRDADTLKIRHIFNCSDTISDIAWSADSELILCCSYKKGLIQVWSLKDLEWTCVIEEGASGLTGVRWAPDGRHVLSFSDFQLRITVWSLITKEACYIQYPKFNDRGFAFRKDGRYLALAERRDSKDTISIYDCEEWTLLKHFPVDTMDLEDLAWSPDGRYIAVWDTNLEYKVLIYFPDGRLIKSYSAYEYGLGVKSACWSPSSQFFAIGSYDEKQVFNEVDRSAAVRGSVLQTHERPKLDYTIIQPPVTVFNEKVDLEKPNPKRGIGICEFSCDGQYLATRNDNMPRTVWIWDLVNLCQVALIQQGRTVRQLKWNPIKPKVLAFTCGGSYFYVYRGPMQGCEPIEVPTLNFNITKIEWSPDGGGLLLMDKDKFCVVFLLSDDDEEEEMQRHHGVEEDVEEDVEEQQQIRGVKGKMVRDPRDQQEEEEEEEEEEIRLTRPSTGFRSGIMGKALRVGGHENHGGKFRQAEAEAEEGSVVVSPGKASGHAHTVAGSSLFGFSSTGTEITKAPCTSCSVTPDKSNYWYPSLHYVRDDGQYQYVPTSVITYYEVRGQEYNHEFPEGFGMIAGNPFRRSYDAKVEEHKVIEWLCIGGDNPDNGRGATIPQNCDGDIRGQIHFPMCGDGRLYSADQSHVTYPRNKEGVYQMDGGVCPESHPIRYVKLFLEFWFGTGNKNKYPRRNGINFVLSQGDATGYGLHADFMNGWEKNVLQTILDTCDYGSQNGFFNPSNCDYIKNGKFQDNAYKKQCNIEDKRLLSYVEPSVAPKLPGCNPMQYGPENAVPKKCDGSENPPPPPTITYNPPSETTTSKAGDGNGGEEPPKSTVAPGNGDGNGYTTVPTVTSTSAPGSGNGNGDGYPVSTVAPVPTKGPGGDGAYTSNVSSGIAPVSTSTTTTRRRCKPKTKY
ncbi:WD repeat-containing protein wrap73 [Phlyctochytrium planicorne]|nr:WD repeat-containing protein wrap73 [Phlyctochytrium planicorne]